MTGSGFFQQPAKLMDDQPQSANLPAEVASPSAAETAPSAGKPRVADKAGEADQPSGASSVPKPKPSSPAQVAASKANLKKAWAAPKEKIYAQTPKRKASQLATLGIAQARNRRSLAQTVEQLDRAFPPLQEQSDSSTEGVGPSTVEGSDSSGPLDSSTPSSQDPISDTTGDVHQAGDAHEPPIQNRQPKMGTARP